MQAFNPSKTISLAALGITTIRSALMVMSLPTLARKAWQPLKAGTSVVFLILLTDALLVTHEDAVALLP